MLRFRILSMLASLFVGTELLKADYVTVCPSFGTLICQALVTEVDGDFLRVQASFDWSGTAPGTATFGLTDSYLTDGPPRPGFMVLTMFHDGEHSSLTTSSSTLALDGFGCSGSAPFGFYCFQDSLQSVMLGTILNLSLSATINARAFPDPFYLEGGSRFMLVSATFYENSAGTPGAQVRVTQTVVSEPRSILLLVSGLLVIWGAVSSGRRIGAM